MLILVTTSRAELTAPACQEWPGTLSDRKNYMTTHSSQETVPLADGVSIPLMGFGTWRLTGTGAYDGVRAALEVGYRHLDTATMYRNEEQVGAAVRDSGVGRGCVFVTTKLPSSDAGREAQTLDASLKALGFDFVDLWLVHWPPGGQASPDIWRAFTDALERGKTRAIGVSNHSAAQIDQLAAATGQAPAINQIPWSPFRYDAGIAAGLRERGVVLEGYSPLKLSDTGDPVLREIAGAHGKTAAQVILRWHVEHGFVVIPRSSRRERIEENFAIFDFELTPGEISRIDGLGA
jgi:diketogulonate reductase-like aldo/keto reductase